MSLGVWLCVVVIHNSKLKPEDQIYFEKVSTWRDSDEGGSIGPDGGAGNILHLYNESPFTHTPVDNLCFYLLTLSFVTILGGCGRIITTSFFCVHFCNKVTYVMEDQPLFNVIGKLCVNYLNVFFILQRLTNQLFWSWLVLSTLVVTIEFLVTFDILLTLSHNDVAPPYERDFFFGNDNHTEFYWLCHIFRYFIWIDLCLSGLAQSAVCWVYRNFTQGQI